MDLMVIGGDMRFAHLTEMATKLGIRAASIGLDTQHDAMVSTIGRARALLMPNPWRGAFRLPCDGCPWTAFELMEMARPDAIIMMLGVDNMPITFFEEYGERVVDLLSDEEFAVHNAVLTAEGAIASAMMRSDVAICESNCLVIGYGRIGRPLSRMLMGLGAQVTAAARREEVRALILSDGARAVDIKDITSSLADTRFIFSTPPEYVLDDAALGKIDEGALLMDLASPPYGFDMDRATRMGIRAVREPGLPGRYCPRSAAGALLDAALKAMKAARKEHVQA